MAKFHFHDRVVKVFCPYLTCNSLLLSIIVLHQQWTRRTEVRGHCCLCRCSVQSFQIPLWLSHTNEKSLVRNFNPVCFFKSVFFFA